MIKQTEDISSTKKRISIEIPTDAIEGEIKNSLNDLRVRTRLPGFRKGKAPLSLIEKRFGKDVEAETMEKLVPKFYSEAIKEASIVPVGRPVLEGGLELKRNEPLDLTFTVEVRPEVELSYEGLEVEDVPLMVEDRDVEETIKRLHQERATYEPSPGPVAKGQLIIMDYECVEDGKEFKDEVFKVGSDLMPMSFSESLVGVIKGGTAEFKVDFPKDYHSSELAGQKRTFRVTVKEIKDEHLPSIDDEFAKDLEFDDLDALRSHIRERMEQQQRDSIERMQKGLLVKKLVEDHEFEPPESFVETELENMLARERSVSLSNPSDTENTPEFDEEKKREEFLPEALSRAKASVALDIIGEKEGVEVTEDDMKQRLAAMSIQVNMTPDNLIKYYMAKDGSLEGLRQAVFEEKVLDLVLGKAMKTPADKKKRKADKK
jgi:trigger factor